jgi:hypothetical protein
VRQGDPYGPDHPEDHAARWKEQLEHLFHDPTQIRRRDITTLAADYLLAHELATDAEHRYFQRGNIYLELMNARLEHRNALLTKDLHHDEWRLVHTFVGRVVVGMRCCRRGVPTTMADPWRLGNFAVWSNNGWLTDHAIAFSFNGGPPTLFADFKRTSAYARACRDIKTATDRINQAQRELHDAQIEGWRADLANEMKATIGQCLVDLYRVGVVEDGLMAHLGLW